MCCLALAIACWPRRDSRSALFGIADVERTGDAVSHHRWPQRFGRDALLVGRGGARDYRRAATPHNPAGRLTASRSAAVSSEPKTMFSQTVESHLAQTQVAEEISASRQTAVVLDRMDFCSHECLTWIKFLYSASDQHAAWNLLIGL